MGSSVLGHTHAWALWGYLFIDEFSQPWKQGSCFLWKLVTMCTPFFQTFQKMDQRVLGGFDLPHKVHAHFSTSFLHLTCAVLISGSQNKDIYPRKVLLLLPHSPLLQPHPVLSHNMLLPQSLAVITNNPWSASGLSSCLSVWNMHISPLSSGLLQTCSECKYAARETLWFPSVLIAF